MHILDKIPLSILLLAAATLGAAPFFPEPHLVEKLRMLGQGTLVQRVDNLDLLMHAAPFAVLFAKLARMSLQRR